MEIAKVSKLSEAVERAGIALRDRRIARDGSIPPNDPQPLSQDDIEDTLTVIEAIRRPLTEEMCLVSTDGRSAQFVWDAMFDEMLKAPRF